MTTSQTKGYKTIAVKERTAGSATEAIFVGDSEEDSSSRYAIEWPGKPESERDSRQSVK